MLRYPQIDPIALTLGPLRIHWYGIMYLLGFAVAFFLGRSRIRKGRFAGLSEERFSDLLFNGMLGVIIGVASVIMMVAIGAGAKAYISRELGNLGTATGDQQRHA